MFYDFLMISLWFSYSFLMLFLWFFVVGPFCTINTIGKAAHTSPTLPEVRVLVKKFGFSVRFPYVLWFPYDFFMIFLWFSYAFLMFICGWSFLYHKYHWKSCSHLPHPPSGFWWKNWIFRKISMRFPYVLWFSYDFFMIFLWFSYDFFVVGPFVP